MGRIPKGRNSAVGQWAILVVALVLVAIIGYLYVGPHLDGGSGEPIVPDAREASEAHRNGPDVDVHVEHPHTTQDLEPVEGIFGDDTPAPPKVRPRPKPRTNRRRPPEKPKPTEEHPAGEEVGQPDDAGSGGMNPTEPPVETPTEPTPTPESPPTEDPLHH